MNSWEIPGNTIPIRHDPLVVQAFVGVGVGLLDNTAVHAGQRKEGSLALLSLRHRKWWARQYSFLNIGDRESLDRIIQQLMDHQTRPTALCSAPHGWDTIRLD